MTDQQTADVATDAWDGFVRGHWSEEIDVRDFIQRNYTPYEGDASFLDRADGKDPARVGNP